MNEYMEGVIRKAVQRNAEKIGDSEIFVGIVTSKYLEDPYCAMQLGLAILMNKPIRLLVRDGVEVPAMLAKVAERIEICKGPDDMGLCMDRLLAD